MVLQEAKALSLQLPDRVGRPMFGTAALATLFRNVDLRMDSGETLGIVGESGPARHRSDARG